MKRASRLTILAIPAAATLVLPSLAWAADGAPSNTLRATIDGAGVVKSVTSLAGNGTSSPYTGELPLKLSISRTVEGNSSTYTYHVENTFAKTQQVSYTDTQGVKHTTSASVQLPLVAQLGVTLPKSFTNVSAPSAVVTTDPDGTNRILWNLVLFSPLGSPTQDETFTVTGSGVPTSELVATTVNPATTAGLSKAQQDATASSQQDDFWQGYASGGNDGLTQLASGTASMIAGLKKLSAGAHALNDGLKTAQAGANKLDAGTASAYAGSRKLTTGLKAIHTGQASLTAGLAQIQAGLALLDDKSPGKGVQAAVDGIAAIKAGVEQMLVGLVGTGGTPTAPSTLDGTPTGSPSILLGLLATAGQAPPLGGGIATLTHVRDGLLTDAGTLSALATALASTDPATAAALAPIVTDLFTDSLPVGSPGAPAGGILTQLLFGLTHTAGTLGSTDGGGLVQGLQAIAGGLSHPVGALGATDPGGVDQGLAALLDPTLGLPAAVAGIDALTTGASAALTGSTALTTGSASALTGSQALTGGLGQLSTGQHQVATGLPAAVDGSDQIAGGIDQVLDGATQVNGGILSVQSGAVGPLNTQLLQGSQNQKKQIAIVDAAAALAAQAPGGAGTSYVLTQFNPKLTAATTPATSGSSHTGRNVGIGLGGFAALVIAVVAGFALGRRSQVVTTVA
jgi:putative membrane protein